MIMSLERILMEMQAGVYMMNTDNDEEEES